MLQSDNSWHAADMYFLRRFLRARQHDLKKARDMYAASVKWRAEFGVDTIMEDFHFHERDAFISLYPQGLPQDRQNGKSALSCPERASCARSPILHT